MSARAAPFPAASSCPLRPGDPRPLPGPVPRRPGFPGTRSRVPAGLNQASGVPKWSSRGQGGIRHDRACAGAGARAAFAGWEPFDQRFHDRSHSLASSTSEYSSCCASVALRRPTERMPIRPAAKTFNSIPSFPRASPATTWTHLGFLGLFLFSNPSSPALSITTTGSWTGGLFHVAPMWRCPVQ